MKIFVTGASGFIGGSVASRLVLAGHAVRGLVRDPAKLGAVRRTGVEPVLGTLDDTALLSREAQAADAVINAASSDDRPAIEAIVAALAGSGKALIHTSGSSIVADEAMGEPSDRIFDEDTPFNPAPEKAARVALDRFVLAAPGVRSIVLCNSLIYGTGLGAEPESAQLPRLAAEAHKTGIARHIGRGRNIWSTVHIADVAALYLLALDKAPAGTFCFVENGETSFGAMVGAIATRLGLGAPQPWPAEQAIAALGRQTAVFSLGSNSRVRAHRARSVLGWAPTYGSVLDWIGTELPKA
ncbi:MAG TPA: NAD-dependent epimerase/dehydratase family protein [Aliidongia sp.]|uniref:NAD-dependent epimerase/dehydratase family protein n=1 Tax=Aliidongia sp. TaxID=1914230 RepID=UPI002DDCF485|nr:NAD-dependent epimerase/dehydratase family protein [Aliidongia sp.]HEV2674834.1 NAD-dependent epimerase/dehydratase family protein [Aliidongia sp.]